MRTNHSDELILDGSYAKQLDAAQEKQEEKKENLPNFG